MNHKIRFAFFSLALFQVAAAQTPSAPTAANQVKFSHESIDIANKETLSAFVKKLKITSLQKPVDLAASYGIFDWAGPTECKELVNVPHAYFCLSARRKDQNAIFARASIFSEGNKYCPTTGQVVPKDHPANILYYYLAGGHDIRGSVLTEFFGLAETEDAYAKDDADQTATNCELNADETAFKENVLDQIVARETDKTGATNVFAVITAPAEFPEASLLKVVSHETLHAQFYLNKGIQTASQKYWEEILTEGERATVKKLLGQNYNVEDFFVLLKEFVSYTLEYGAVEGGTLKDIAATHKQPLIDAIKASTGIDVYQLK